MKDKEIKINSNSIFVPNSINLLFKEEKEIKYSRSTININRNNINITDDCINNDIIDNKYYKISEISLDDSIYKVLKIKQNEYFIPSLYSQLSQTANKYLFKSKDLKEKENTNLLLINKLSNLTQVNKSDDSDISILEKLVDIKTPLIMPIQKYYDSRIFYSYSNEISLLEIKRLANKKDYSCCSKSLFSLFRFPIMNIIEKKEKSNDNNYTFGFEINNIKNDKDCNANEDSIEERVNSIIEVLYQLLLLTQVYQINKINMNCINLMNLFIGEIDNINNTNNDDKVSNNKHFSLKLGGFYFLNNIYKQVDCEIEKLNNHIKDNNQLENEFVFNSEEYILPFLSPNLLSKSQNNDDNKDSNMNNSDLFSVGCVLYYLLSGKTIFDINEIVNAHKKHNYNLKIESLVAIIKEKVNNTDFSLNDSSNTNKRINIDQKINSILRLLEYCLNSYNISKSSNLINELLNFSLFENLNKEILDMYSISTNSKTNGISNISSNNNDYISIISSFNKILSKNPLFIPALIQKGMIAKSVKNYSLALEYYNSALNITIALLADSNQDLECKKNNNTELKTDKKYSEDAININNSILSHPFSISQLIIFQKEILINKGVLYRTSKDYVLSEQQYNQALKIQPHCKYTLYNKATLLKIQSKNKEALELIEKVLSIDPKFTEALFLKGFILKSQSEYNNALNQFNLILTFEENNKEALYWKGVCYDNIEKYYLALECYNKAIVLDNNYSSALRNKALCLRLLGRKEEAIKFYDSLILKYPGNTVIKNARYSMDYDSAFSLFDVALNWRAWFKKIGKSNLWLLVITVIILYLSLYIGNKLGWVSIGK